MFDFILYPVSAILWVWHAVFGALLEPDSGFAWSLSVFFLVFTLRVLLIKPAISQLRAGRKMQKFAPKIKELQEKYGNDRQRLMLEMQKLQSEGGFNPLGGCLPALLQIPVFLSLFYVLRSFTPGAESNYVFDREGVASFINADLFGAKLGSWISQSEAELVQFGTDRAEMLTVGLPLMVLAAAATYFTMKMSMRRQTESAMANPQTAMISKFLLYIAPAGVLFSGLFLPMPIAVLLYFLANNVWTFGQQHLLTNMIDREEARAAEAAERPDPKKRDTKDGEDGS
ncbi:YidC/Oxa1 family membrane protein insertase [Tamaricihabitans halophyticus]|uniref:Membrane protein insertase YidC n=1 Tax=Tamaricihabitans halophyticus TaxID=1262583 RepID=A0A4R2QWH8_9PSEU|nr:membrane protein insertase YidC [Tamaricihabitans halophyticus]TCP53624.1 YidC/Oxa1 family membrane protein insertase [Tamaricihabitans halophyticus]